jgi:hypothetical protein
MQHCWRLVVCNNHITWLSLCPSLQHALLDHTVQFQAPVGDRAQWPSRLPSAPACSLLVCSVSSCGVVCSVTGVGQRLSRSLSRADSSQWAESERERASERASQVLAEVADLALPPHVAPQPLHRRVSAVWLQRQGGGHSTWWQTEYRRQAH